MKILLMKELIIKLVATRDITMYINPTKNHDFLVLLQDKGLKNFRAFIRSARLKPCGNWAMGTVTFKRKKISISGDYGSGGLPITVRPNPRFSENEFEKEQRENIIFAYKNSVPLPPWLEEEWGHGTGGHSCAGSERISMEIWANRHKNALRFGKRGTFKIKYVIEYDEEYQKDNWHTSINVFHHKKDAEEYMKNIAPHRLPEIFEVGSHD